MAIETENPSKKPIFLIIILVFLVGIFILIYFIFGFRGFFKILLWFGILAVILILIGLVFFAVYWLLTQKRPDMIHILKQRVIRTALQNAPETKQLLYFRGDGTIELGAKKIGYVLGICRIFVEKTFNTIAKDGKIKKDKKGKPITETKVIPEDCIVFKKSLTPILSWLEDKKVLRVLKHERSSLSGDIIYLYDGCFAPELFGYNYLSRRFLDSETIDRSIARAVHRYQLQDNLKELKVIVSESIAISPHHQKLLEKELSAPVQTIIKEKSI